VAGNGLRAPPPRHPPVRPFGHQATLLATLKDAGDPAVREALRRLPVYPTHAGPRGSLLAGAVSVKDVTEGSLPLRPRPRRIREGAWRFMTARRSTAEANAVRRVPMR